MKNKNKNLEQHNRELLQTINEIKVQLSHKPEFKGYSEEQLDGLILDMFLKDFDEGGIDKEDLLGLMDLMGYSPTDEFLEALERDDM